MDDEPDIDLTLAMEAWRRAGDAIASATRDMKAAGVPRNRMLSVLAHRVTLSVFEVTDVMGSDDDDLRQLSNEIAVLLSSPLAHMLPAGSA